MNQYESIVKTIQFKTLNMSTLDYMIVDIIIYNHTMLYNVKLI